MLSSVVLLTAVIFVPLGDGETDETYASAGLHDFGVEAHVAAPVESGHTDGTSPATQIEENVLPACGNGESVGDCEPVTTCEPDPDSPTGYRELTSYGYSPVNSDFSLGEPCTPEQAARPSLPGLILRAFKRVPLPAPQLSIQPPNGKTLVGLETIYSTKAEPFTRTLTLLGREVTLRIEPSSFLWRHGDGTSQTTDWAGKAWDHDAPDIDGYLTHVYEHTGELSPSVEVTWSAEFRVGGGAWQQVNGTVTRAGTPVPLRVLEGQPVLNSY